MAKAAQDKSPRQSVLWPKYQAYGSWGVQLTGTQVQGIKGSICHNGTLPPSVLVLRWPRSRAYRSSITSCVLRMDNCLWFAVVQEIRNRECRAAHWGRVWWGQTTGTTLMLPGFPWLQTSWLSCVWLCNRSKGGTGLKLTSH